MTHDTDLAILVASLNTDGVGKMRAHLVNEIARRGYKVDLVTAGVHSPYMRLLSPAVNLVRIGSTNAVTGIPSVAAYLLRAHPRVLLAQRIRVNILALRARALVRANTRVFTTVNTNLTEKLASHRPRKRAAHLKQLKHYLPRNDGIIAVSSGVAQHTATLVGLPIDRIQVAPNPTVTPELVKLAAAPVEHPWFAPGQPPVILGVGRLDRAKDLPTMIRAFAKLRSTRPCRLVILGEGELRNELTELATSLGVIGDFDLPGFVANPYAYMAKAGLYVLSSIFEGSPNVLIEALSVGAPLVATDCPYGPREILEGGRYGPLVPVGDVDALTAAMVATLDNPPNRALLAAAAQRYTVERSASTYISILGLDSPG